MMKLLLQYAPLKGNIILISPELINWSLNLMALLKWGYFKVPLIIINE